MMISNAITVALAESLVRIDRLIESEKFQERRFGVVSAKDARRRIDRLVNNREVVADLRFRMVRGL